MNPKSKGNTINNISQSHGSPQFSFRIEDAARALGIGRTLLFRLIRDGEIKIVKIGKRSVITAAELEAFLAKGGAK